MEERFDVVLYGIKDGRERSEVAQALAGVFSIALDRAQRLVGRDKATVIKKAISLEQVNRLTSLLSEAGAMANYKPTAFSGKRLELVPKTVKVDCPECSHHMELAEGEARPATCPACGLVFSKYEKLKDRKHEVEAIRARLERMQALREEEQQKQAAQQEDDRRRKELEEQIRKELGIPPLVDRKWKLWSSAVATLFLGVGLGVAGTALLTQESRSLDASTLEVAEESALALASQMSQSFDASGTAALLGSEMSPSALQAVGQKSMQDLAALSQDILEQASLPERQGDPVGAEAVEGALAGTSGSPGSTAARHDLGLIDTENRNLERLKSLVTVDAEWRDFLSTKARQALDAGDHALAERITTQIQDPSARLEGLARIAAQDMAVGDADSAQTRIGLVIDQSMGISLPLARVERITAIVPVLAQSQGPWLVAPLIEKAQEWTATLAPTSVQAEGWARIARAQAETGLAGDARQSIRRAVEALNEAMPLSLNIRIFNQLATAVDRLGARDVARRVLEENAAKLDKISTSAERDAVVLGLANTWIEIGQLERGFDLAARAFDPYARDRFLLDLVAERSVAGRYLGLSQIAERIQTPEDRARAYGLLGVASDDPVLAREHFEKALAAVRDVQSGPLQAEIQAEIARMLMRSGYRQSGTQLFGKIESLLERQAPGTERDIGWAILAANRSRALEPAIADDYLQHVSDTEVLDLARLDLNRVAQAIHVLQAAPAGSP